jgi:hypothetical protein
MDYILKMSNFGKKMRWPSGVNIIFVLGAAVSSRRETPRGRNKVNTIEMRIILVCILLTAFSKLSFAQTNFNKKWVQGFGNVFIACVNNPDFEFCSYRDTSFLVKNSVNMGGASICDSFGEVYLTSCGFNVIDKNKNFVDGLDSIGGRKFIKYNNGFSDYSQFSIILPMTNNVYYFVNNSVSDSFMNYYYTTPNPDALFDELMYTKIDMKGNGGAGKVIQREIKILKNATLSKVQMIACKHGNGKDWWLFKQARGANKVFKFLFTQDSVYNYGIQNFPDPVFSIFDEGGQSMFSQDGTKYATTCMGTGKIFLTDFDRCTGLLSNPYVLINDSLNAHNPFDTTLKDNSTEGLAFSPNGRFLYVSMATNIVQFDLLAANIQLSKVVVAELDTTWQASNYYTSMYLGPDNKLYVGNWGSVSKAMSYFEYPNEKGLASGFCKRCFRFPKQGVTAPPTMPNYDLGADNCWPLGNEELGPESYREDDELVVYPNPASSKLEVRYEILDKRNASIEMYNTIGLRVYSSTISNLTSHVSIDVSRFAKGIYLLKVGEKVRRVVVE